MPKVIHCKSYIQLTPKDRHFITYKGRHLLLCEYPIELKELITYSSDIDEVFNYFSTSNENMLKEELDYINEHGEEIEWNELLLTLMLE